VHVPALPDSAHDRQLPAHALRQQAPCSQKPLAHSVAPAQAAPVGFLVQAVPLQTFGATQSLDVEQMFRQLPFVPQT